MIKQKPFSLSFRVIISNDTGRCLILRRTSACTDQPGKWDFPGGKVNPSENFNDALYREVKEETAIKIVLEKAVGLAKFELDSVNVVCVMMEGKHISGDVILSDEHDLYKWVFVDEVLKMNLADWFIPFWKEYSQNAETE